MSIVCLGEMISAPFYAKVFSLMTLRTRRRHSPAYRPHAAASSPILLAQPYHLCVLCAWR